MLQFIPQTRGLLMLSGLKPQSDWQMRVPGLKPRSVRQRRHILLRVECAFIFIPPIVLRTQCRRWLQTIVSGGVPPVVLRTEEIAATLFPEAKDIASCILSPSLRRRGLGVVRRLRTHTPKSSGFSSARRLLFPAGYFQCPESNTKGL